MMPLYSNILLSGEDDDKTTQQLASAQQTPSAVSASMRLLQDHLRSKKRAKQTNLCPTKVQKSTNRSQIISESSLHKQTDYDWDLDEEYDPMMPNSFEILQLQQIEAGEQRLVARKSNRADMKPADDFDADDNAKLKLIPANDNFDGSSVAAKIMAKMGYKVGHGLGKDQQGTSTPLEVEKSGPSAGRIQKPRTPPKDDTEPRPTRVLMLQNMVGPGEVDDELESETKEECKKYGDVVKCLIYEIPNKSVSDNEAVRIFVEFTEEGSCKKAADDLNGRYFGGRVVRASFYDVEKFNRYELVP